LFKHVADPLCALFTLYDKSRDRVPGTRDKKESLFSRTRIKKRKQLISHIKKYNGFLLREGSRHSIYQRGRLKTEVPRHNEVVDELARKICKDLDIPFMR